MQKIEQARRLREKGMPIPEIAIKLNASFHSVAKWVGNIEVIDQFKPNSGKVLGGKALSEKYKAKRMEYQSIGRAKAKENRPLHFYWGEGTKSRNKLVFINSDSNMLLLYMRFLREELGVEDKDIKLYIQCHTTNTSEIKEIEQYWISLFNLPSTVIRKTTIKKGNSERKHNVYKNGFCAIAVYKTELVQHIYGAIQEYVGFDDPDWLF
jgi:hypothetical protein